MSAHQRLSTEGKTRLARAQFFGDEWVHPGLVPETVLRSWIRSRKCHLQHSGGLIFNNQISPALAKRVKDERRDFLRACAPEIKRLCQSLQDINWLVICTDSEGVIVDTGNYGSSSRWSTNPLGTGRILREAEFGTNAPGCVLVERQPIVINRNEHFIDDMRHYVCAAVQILGSRGEIAGVLDITSDTRLLNDAIVEMVALGARAIENRLIAEMWPQFSAVSIHYDPRLVGSPLAGVIVVSPDRRLRAANRTAREMLGINVIPDTGIELQSLFEDTGLFWHRHAEERTIPVRASCLNGAKFYWRASCPCRPKRVSSQGSQPPDRAFSEVGDPDRPAEQLVLSDPPARGIAAGAKETGRDAVRRGMREAVISFVDKNIANPTISTASVAAHFHISTRYLQQLFENNECTFAKMLHNKRLDRCARELIEASSRQSISAIAYRSGFNNFSNFCRVFRRRYGTSATDYRASREGGGS